LPVAGPTAAAVNRCLADLAVAFLAAVRSPCRRMLCLKPPCQLLLLSIVCFVAVCVVYSAGTTCKVLVLLGTSAAFHTAKSRMSHHRCDLILLFSKRNSFCMACGARHPHDSCLLCSGMSHKQC
jgi:hypothetical protein